MGVRSLTNGIVDTITAHGKLVFGIFALMAECEAALVKERTHAGLAGVSRPRPDGWPETEDDPAADRQGAADVRLSPVHHGRDRRVLRCHADDDLPQHPHRREVKGRLMLNICFCAQVVMPCEGVVEPWRWARVSLSSCSGSGTGEVSGG